MLLKMREYEKNVWIDEHDKNVFEKKNKVQNKKHEFGGKILRK